MRGRNGEDGFGYGEFVARRVEEDVGANGRYEEGYGGFDEGLLLLRGRCLTRVEACGGFPVVVEERVFVSLGDEGGEACVEESQVGGQTE